MLVDFFDGTDAAFPMIFFENYCSGVVVVNGNEKRLFKQKQQVLKITPGVHCCEYYEYYEYCVITYAHTARRRGRHSIYVYY